ncbi:MAG: RNA-binding protein [Deltaproteobacteria bacterium]|nr:MAG: RNA-binding protein [Deltaproteobacteria bacterium]RLA87267.1 MAG: RNA-binding protein [Deltaproteobacteria bacterium]
MCEANVYLERDGEEELVLESVYLIRPEGERLFLVNIFGEQKLLRATFKLLDFTEDKIILKERKG